MNVFNRALVVALLVAFVGLGLVVATEPDLIVALVHAWTAGATLAPQDRIYAAALGAALALSSAVILYLELRPANSKTVIVSRLSDGAAAIEVHSVAHRVRQAVEALEGIRQVIPQVAANGRNVNILITVLATPDVDVPAKVAEIGTVVRETVASMGIGMGRQRIHLRYESATGKSAQRA